MTTRTGENYAHEELSSCDTLADQNFEHEQLSSATEGDTVGDAACTVYSVQAVAGVGTAGCMIAGLDMGRRE